MNRKLKVFVLSGIFVLAAVGATSLPAARQQAGTAAQSSKGDSQDKNAPGQDSPSKDETKKPVPAHHTAPPSAPLADTLDPAQFNDLFSHNSYTMAAKIKSVLYEQPCYCYCDANDGHHSLYDCFATDHASFCNTCRQEAIFAYQQTRKGQTPAEIRNEIIRGDWKKIDPKDYQTLKEVR